MSRCTLRIPEPNEQFGHLTFLQVGAPGERGRQMGLFQCQCGATIVRRLDAIYSGNTKSCGCFRRERMPQFSPRAAERRRAHGEGYREKEYRAWHNLKQRCLNPNNVKFPEYGARGITVCERWLHSYEAFLTDMGRAPSPKHSIDRIDNDKGYSPENCRWATGVEQYANRRNRIAEGKL